MRPSLTSSAGFVVGGSAVTWTQPEDYKPERKDPLAPLRRMDGKAMHVLFADGTVRPIVGARFPLDRAADAMRLIEERGALGKVVLEVAE